MLYCLPTEVKKGWIKAFEILVNDEVILYSNTNGKVLKTALKKLTKAEVTYNFEVEDYHNYFVTEESILVHNDCSVTSKSQASNSSTNLHGKAHGSEIHKRRINSKA